ncbi:MAG: OsmC family protein [Pseudomonadota bacterium]
MSKDQASLDAQNRVIELFQKDPKAALSTVQVSARLGDGLYCTVKEADHELAMDLPPVVGGENAAPGPGVFARAALAGCILQVLKLTAIRKGIDLGEIELSLEVDFDDAVMFGLGQNQSPILRSRITISTDVDLPQPDLEALVFESLEMDPYFLAWRNQQEVKVDVKRN